MRSVRVLSLTQRQSWLPRRLLGFLPYPPIQLGSTWAARHSPAHTSSLMGLILVHWPSEMYFVERSSLQPNGPGSGITQWGAIFRYFIPTSVVVGHMKCNIMNYLPIYTWNSIYNQWSTSGEILLAIQKSYYGLHRNQAQSLYAYEQSLMHLLYSYTLYHCPTYMPFYSIWGNGLMHKRMLCKSLIHCLISTTADTMNIPLPLGYTTWQCNPSQAAFTKHTYTHTPWQQWAPFSMTACDEWRAERPFFLPASGSRDSRRTWCWPETWATEMQHHSLDLTGFSQQVLCSEFSHLCQSTWVHAKRVCHPSIYTYSLIQSLTEIVTLYLTTWANFKSGGRNWILWLEMSEVSLITAGFFPL